MLIKFRAGEKFSFLQEFKISFELRFTTFSQKKISKNPKNKPLSLQQKLITLLNLEYLLISVAPGNHKSPNLFIIFPWEI